jgi:predicted glycogen debranching enzyme
VIKLEMLNPTVPTVSPEWLEADGLGGFASGTVSGARTRRYHGLLVTALRPPADRVVLVNGVEAWVETARGSVALSCHHYAPDIVYPDGSERIVAFQPEPWPRWVFGLPDGTLVAHELFMTRGSSVVALSWRIVRRSDEGGPVALVVRPLLSGRDVHTVHFENPGFRFEADEEESGVVRWRPYHGLPGVIAISNADYTHDPNWYHNFLFIEDRLREAEFTEDLASPGYFRWQLGKEDAVLLFSTDLNDLGDPVAPESLMRRLRSAELDRRRGFRSPLERSADAFHVGAPDGATLIAGYPWYCDQARDVFLSLPSLFIDAGRLDVAGEVLRTWADRLSGGMLPRSLHDLPPSYDSVDASLLFVLAADRYLEAATAAEFPIPDAEVRTLRAAAEEVIDAYSRGTRAGIRADSDGLLACGEPGTALTWMDRTIGDWVVTPRVGKPVEVQALWINALAAVNGYSPRWRPRLDLARAAFASRFWSGELGWLHDVVDVDHRPGAVDPTMRPSQILAVGGLPLQLLGGLRAARVVQAVEHRLWTPAGLRSLDAEATGYSGKYVGGIRQRDASAHRGSAWPWLLAPFVSAWLRVRGDTPATRAEARARFLTPLRRQLGSLGVHHMPEVADGDPPHTPRGAPFHASGLAALLTLERALDTVPTASAHRHPARHPGRRDRQHEAAAGESTLSAFS